MSAASNLSERDFDIVVFGADMIVQDLLWRGWHNTRSDRRQGGRHLL